MANPFTMDDPFEVQQQQQARASVAVHGGMGVGVDGQVHVASPTGVAITATGNHGMADVQFQGGYAYPAQAAIDVAGAAVQAAGQAAAYGYAAQPVYADYPTPVAHVAAVSPTASAPPAEDTPPVTTHAAPAPGSGIAVHYHSSMSAGVSPSAPPILDETSPTADERKESKAAAAAVLATVGDFPDLSAGMSRPETKDTRDKGRFIIMVTDPEKKGDGMSQFVAYKISTMKELNGSTTQSTVFRRFSDFYWLHDRLAHRYKGCLIPPVPDKAMMGRFTQEFIQERRRGLEIFLNRLAVHRELRDSEDVDVFLHAVDDSVWIQHKAKKEKEEKAAAATATPDPPPAKRGIMTFFKETVQSISNSVGSGKSRPKSEGDLMCDKIQQYADALDTQFTSVHAHVDLLIKRERGLARTWFDFGNACTLLGQYESGQKQAELGAVLAHLGNCADRLSIMLGKKADTENVNFREPIRDYMRIIGAVKAMLKSRSAVLLSYQTAQTTLESRQAKLAELQGKPNKAQAIAAAETAVQVAQAEADNAQRELTRVTDLTLHETQRFRAEKHKDLRQVIIEFVKLQAEDAKASARAWDGILEEIQK